ncbi:hypothetical protein CDL15_Pgr005128 [Punica granatum]|uniref:Uncharacterized protein n=1 Tax=Punica granatum TaxID=22663 RepID=A0A218WPZ6_PUNGR|nr:hypothetical protein CDL15_Pgr005128 [Punica granatum]PKI71069.1 hypothetical protein CRG98_008534 [Punica granatum]
MDDDGPLPTTASSGLSSKKEAPDSSLFGRGRYKFWALAAILLLACWSMFTGTVSLRWSAGNLDPMYDDLDILVHDDIDVLEMEDREEMVKHMWDVYTSSRQVRLAQFWREAFEAAFEDMTSEVPGIREAATSEIAKMSLRSIIVHPPPVQTTVGIHP